MASPHFIRKRKIIFLTNSGALIYRRPPPKGTKGKTNKVGPASYLGGESCTDRRGNLIVNYDVGGADWSRWAGFFDTFITEYGCIMEMCPDGIKRFPSHVSVIVVDNLNGCGVDYESKYANQKEDKRMTLEKFVGDVVMYDTLKRFFELLGQCRSAVYCQTVSAGHWGMPAVVNDIADYVRIVARGYKIATLSAEQFWHSIKAYMGPEQLLPRDGETADESVPDEDVANWHHCELGTTYGLPYHWDRYLFRRTCYMETSLIHESVKGEIFNMDLIKRLSDNIKSEAEVRRLTHGDQENKVEEIQESIVPNPASYRTATSPTPKRRPKVAVKEQLGEDADASQRSDTPEPGENADDSAAIFEAADKRIAEIMNVVTQVYKPDGSKMFMREDEAGRSRQFVLPPWASGRNTAKCAFCEESSDGLEMATGMMKSNREIHEAQVEANAKKEKELGVKSEPKRMKKTYLHHCFGHGQDAIEGLRECDGGLQKVLGKERLERNAATEFEGAVKTESFVDTQKGDDAEGDKSEEKTNPDSQEADDKDDNLFDGPGFSEMDALTRKRAKEVYTKVKKATIKAIPVSLLERGKLIVATAVINDVRPESHLAAHDTTGMYKGKDGNAYDQKGASGSISLLSAIGPAPNEITMPLPAEYRNRLGFKWMVIDGCRKLPNASPACAPLKRGAAQVVQKGKGKGKGKEPKGPWDVGSRTLNTAVRHGKNIAISYRTGGWVDCESALGVVKYELRRLKFVPYDYLRVATVHWLFGFLCDTTDPTLKSRYQLAGVVDNGGTLVEICYVRCKSGHNEQVAQFIPEDSIYTKVTQEHLKHISCICHKTRFENVKSIFSLGLMPGGIGSRNDRAHINFTPFPPFDKRNMAPGRLEGECNVVIIVKPEVVLHLNLRVSMDAILVSDSVVPWTAIELIYVVPPIFAGESWVLYNPDLRERKIMGYTAPTHGKRADDRQPDQTVPGNEGLTDCGWRTCPCCKSINPKGFTACLDCRVMFTFDAISEVSRVTQRSVGKGENAGSHPASSDSKAVADLPVLADIRRVLKIAKMQVRKESNLVQRFSRPGDLLWESVNSNMKWRWKFDNLHTRSNKSSSRKAKSDSALGNTLISTFLIPVKGERAFAPVKLLVLASGFTMVKEWSSCKTIKPA